ncbi:hypothetical protein WN944_009570 [Citrus x changshan-huyou]|uniref:Uncharacterized protein n=1 Tax=Citrus x changshan-huyou TaxID=2935761 RepID=A0AAP0MQ23_9ROSI
MAVMGAELVHIGRSESKLRRDTETKASYTPLMNKFGGSLPQTCAKSCVLTSLNLNGNWLEGPMPPSLVNYRHYKLVYVLFME